MNESYVECMVARKSNPLFGVLKYLIYILTGVSLVAAVSWNPIFFIPCIIFGLLVYLVVPGFELEYEYLYVDRELSIDKIMSKQKRKKVRNLELSKMEIMCPANSHQLDSYKARKVKTSDFSSHEQDAQVWVIVYKDQSSEELIKIEPNADLLKAIKGVYPRKVTEV